MTREQTRGCHAHGSLGLLGCFAPGGVESPYFQRQTRGRRHPSRDILSTNSLMAVTKAIAVAITPYTNDLGVDAQYYDGNTFVEEYNLEITDTSTYTTPATIKAAAEAVIIAHAVAQGYTAITSGAQIEWANSGITVATRSFTNPSRSLNSAFQISTTQDAIVSYTVDIAATLSLTTGQAGTVTLQYADDSGMSTNLKTVQSSVNGNSGVLAIGLGLTQTATAALGGVIPAGKYVKLVTANTTGTPTFTMRAAQEVLL